MQYGGNPPQAPAQIFLDVPTAHELGQNRIMSVYVLQRTVVPRLLQAKSR